MLDHRQIMAQASTAGRRVVVATAFGGPEVLSLVEQPVAEPGRGEVTIAVEAIGVNPLDRLLYSGAFGEDERLLGQPVGQELAGLVTAAGPAGPLRTGDQVIAYRSDIPGGAYATAVTWPAHVVVPKPASLAFEPAAGLLFAGAAAIHALEATAVGDGDTVLIHGASGTVGSIAAQVARLRGATAIGTADPRHHDRLRDRGIDPIAYGNGLADRARTHAGEIDAAIDAVGTDEAIDASLTLVADRARIATLVAFQRGADAGIKTLGAAGGATDPAPPSAPTPGRSSSHSPPTARSRSRSPRPTHSTKSPPHTSSSPPATPPARSSSGHSRGQRLGPGSSSVNVLVLHAAGSYRSAQWLRRRPWAM